MTAEKHFDSIEKVVEELATAHYIADRALATVLFLSHQLEKPIFLEGEPGVGKTEVGLVMAGLFNTELIRLQCYEGLDVSTSLYEWNYPKQVNYQDYGKNFTVHTISNRKAPAFGTVDYVNDDDHLDLIVSHYSPFSLLDNKMYGKLVLFLGDGTMKNWQEIVLDDKVPFPHKTTVIDINDDGKMDIFHPSGFLPCESVPGGKPCGSLAWFENQGNGSFKKHQIYGPQSKLYFWRAVFEDFDRDGLLDFITVGERKPATGKPTAKVLFFRGIPDAPFFVSEPEEIIEGLGSLPSGMDIDEDGDLDLFSAEYFLPRATFPKFSFAWLEQVKVPAKQ